MKKFVLLACTSLLAACQPSPPQYAGPAPVPVNAPAAPAVSPTTNTSDMLLAGMTGLAAGHLLTRSAQSNAAAAAPAAQAPVIIQRNTTIIQKNVHVAAPVPAAKPASPPQPSAPAARPTVPTYRSSSTPIANAPSYRTYTAPSSARITSPSSSSSTRR